MTIPARYAHTNLIAKDWRRLVHFYTEVFGCVPVPPERDFSGPDLEAGTGIPGVTLKGIHLRLPGYPDGHGPTLEVFTLEPAAARLDRPAPNRPGYGHIAFSVPDVAAAREEVLRAGGSAIGEVVTLRTADGARVTWTYLTDPEGNMLELQSWAPA